MGIEVGGEGLRGRRWLNPARDLQQRNKNTSAGKRKRRLLTGERWVQCSWRVGRLDC